MVETVTDLAERISPAETKGERTRRRILEMAIDRFGRRGYRATSVSEIARAAGLTQAASYAYYENKEALFLAAVDADATALIEEAHVQVAGTPIRMLLPAYVVFLMAGLDTHPLAKRVLGGHEPDAVPRLVGLPAQGMFGEMIAQQVSDAKLRGEVRQDVDPETFAAGAESLVMSLLFVTVQAGGAAQPRHQVGVVEAFDLMLRPPG
jgi:AcrR family transcriptional regulator